MEILNRDSLPSFPVYFRWIGWINNIYNTRAIDHILQERCLERVLLEWDKLGYSKMYIKNIFNIFRSIYNWKRPYFLPNDQCYIILKLWWRGVSDCMEFERCMWEFEKIFNMNKRISSIIIDFPFFTATLLDLLNFLENN